MFSVANLICFTKETVMMKNNTLQTGNAAEEIARKYLIRKGYRILETNWHFGHLELDIIARDGEELVIVEVKSRVGEPFEHPSDAISDKKIRMVIDAAEGWIQLKEETRNTRFDLITIVFTGPGTYELEHFDNAFNPRA